ncbi:MAG: acyl-CoA reductase [Akkermansiaceae bacterium]
MSNSQISNLTHLAQAAPLFEPFTGVFDEAALRQWIKDELTPLPNTRFLPPENIVHIISGNTPHAAFQSLLAGLLLGVKNRLKLPSETLLDFETSLAQLPSELQALIETSRELPDHWISEAGALIVYGSDSTIRHFRSLAPLEIPFVAHGHRLGIALIEGPSEEAARLAAKDIGEFDQNGCLSLQTIFVENPHDFAPLLATAMADYEKAHPRADLGPSEHGAISNLRHETLYLAAQEPKKHHLWHSEKSTAWTIVFQDTPEITPSPGNRTVFLKPMAQWPGQRSRSVPPRSFQNFISQIALHPFQERDDLPSPRIFPLGQAQRPPFAWAHDGILPLRSLVRVQTSDSPTS